MLAVTATWQTREAAVVEKHRREKEEWEEAARRYGFRSKRCYVPWETILHLIT